tara:strand:- start:7131 stop:7694 length:564 start_codon:yes stop_codon:yes gene_type:complete
MNSLNKTAKKVKIIISDVDGVLTDGSIYIGENSTEFKKFNVMDGAGVAFAREAEIKIALLSGRFSHATQSRAEELGLGEDCYQGGLNKLETYEEILKKWDYTDEHVAYIGDDLIDLVVMERVGLPIAVANAHPLITKIAKIQTKACGGEGAFREAIEEILLLRGEYNTVLDSLYNRIINGDGKIKSQ